MGKMNEVIVSLIKQQNQSFLSNLKACTEFTNNELNYLRSEITKIQQDDETECLKIQQSCEKDLKRVWIRFSNASDAENCRKQNNLTAIKEIFDHCNIPIKISQNSLESSFFSSKRFFDEQLVP
jgi:hypothetical protein